MSLLDLLLDGDGPGDIEPDDLLRFEDYARTPPREPVAPVSVREPQLDVPFGGGAEKPVDVALRVDQDP